MTRPIFGQTDSPREAARKRRAAEYEERLLQRDRPFLIAMDRGPDGLPTRLVYIRNPHYRPPGSGE